ncbi:MAG: carboxynorspermidine decarboxylase [Pseudomonadota bacterium]
MKVSEIRRQTLKTPCYVYDKQAIRSILDAINEISSSANIKPLYSIKAANNTGLLKLIQPLVTGFSCSSLYELRFANEILDDHQSLHITSPVYKQNEWSDIQQLADYISINSFNQLQNITTSLTDQTSIGIRINPELSFVKDIRYDPCRPVSKLGMTESQLRYALEINNRFCEQIKGVHVHNNCESTNFNEWQQTIERVLEIISMLNLDIEWFNLGGGYLFHDTDHSCLVSIASSIRAKHDVNLFIEPGKAVVGHTGYLISRVIDLIESAEGTIAMLDCSINHLPEVFEYQYKPKVMSSDENGSFQYRLAGCTCLSGDLFGDYTFEQPLSIGDEIIFSHVGAYMQVKANWFNGVSQATTYLFDDTLKQFDPIMQYDYSDFRRR